MNGKVSVIFNRNCFPKTKDFARLGTRAFQFVQKSFDSIRFDSRYRIDFFDSIQFGNLINLPLVHWYSNSKLKVIFIVCTA